MERWFARVLTVLSWAYVKTNKLQDEKVKSVIRCDQNLKVAWGGVENLTRRSGAVGQGRDPDEGSDEGGVRARGQGSEEGLRESTETPSCKLENAPLLPCCNGYFLHPLRPPQPCFPEPVAPSAAHAIATDPAVETGADSKVVERLVYCNQFSEGNGNVTSCHSQGLCQSQPPCCMPHSGVHSLFHNSHAEHPPWKFRAARLSSRRRPRRFGRWLKPPPCSSQVHSHMLESHSAFVDEVVAFSESSAFRKVTHSLRTLPSHSQRPCVVHAPFVIVPRESHPLVLVPHLLLLGILNTICSVIRRSPLRHDSLPHVQHHPWARAHRGHN